MSLANPQSEKELQELLARDLPRLGLKVATVNYTVGRPTGGYTTKGFPDLCLIGKGRVHLWELKTPLGGGRLNDDQLLFHADAREHGYTIPVVESMDEALDWFRLQFDLTRCPICDRRRR